jgi:copper homeostasis protein
LGGLTPSLELVRKISQVVTIPLRVMLRESVSFEVTQESEQDRLCRLAGDISRLEVEGLVLGFLRNRRPDVALLERLLDCAKGLKITFHRAFEEVENPLEAIALLKRYPQIDAILTSGGQTDWSENLRLLADWQQAATPEIAILAGGGLDLHTIEALQKATRIQAFHLGRAVRIPTVVTGTVSQAKVREFLRFIAG